MVEYPPLSERTLELKQLRDGSKVRVFERHDGVVNTRVKQIRVEGSNTSELFPKRISAGMNDRVLALLAMIEDTDTYRSLTDKFNNCESS